MDSPFLHNYQHLFADQRENIPIPESQSRETRIECSSRGRAVSWRQDSDDREEEIDEELLKKTSQLHEALRNMKLLRFQLLQCKIMKGQHLNKCSQLELRVTQTQEYNSSLQLQNEDLQKEIHLYQERITRQRESNHALDINLQGISRKLIQKKVEHKNLTNNADIRAVLSDKENINGIENRKYLSIEKMSLEASNQSAQEMIKLIKQEIARSKQNFVAKQKKKHDLQAEYLKLLDCLKKQQEEGHSKRQVIKQEEGEIPKEVIHLQENYQIKKAKYNDSLVSKKHPKRQKSSKNTSKKQAELVSTDNKQIKIPKNTPASVQTLKKHKIF